MAVTASSLKPLEVVDILEVTHLTLVVMLEALAEVLVIPAMALVVQAIRQLHL
jgi:hypothetical protein